MKLTVTAATSSLPIGTSIGSISVTFGNASGGVSTNDGPVGFPLGVSLVTVDGGVAVENVEPGTPAEEAGLREATGTTDEGGVQVPSGGDVIVEFDGKPVSTSAELQSAVDAKRPGDEVVVVVVRGGDRREVDVTLGTRPPRAP